MNIHGLDCHYFKKNLELIINNIENYKPSEMARSLNTLKDLAIDQADNAATARLDEKQAMMQKVVTHGGIVD